METISCKVCGKDTWVPVLESRDFLHDLPGVFTIARCSNCGFMATNPRPDAREIINYYPEEYAPYQLNAWRVEKMVRYRRKHPKLFRLVDPNIFWIVRKEEKNLTVLEIGCGAGNFLYELRLRFPTWKITGVDFSVNSIEKLHEEKIEAYVSDLQQLREETGSQDVVYGFMIIEHLHYLEKTLAEVRRVLKDDGQFVIAVPNIKSVAFRLFGKYSNFLHIPVHLYHFSEVSLTKVMNQNGFVVEEIIYHRTLQDSAISLGYAIRDSSLPVGLKNILLKILRWRTLYHFLTLPLAYIQAWTKQSPGMTVILRKA